MNLELFGPPPTDVERLRALAREGARRCHCCGGTSTVYKETLGAGQAATLCWLSVTDPGEWIDVQRNARHVTLTNNTHSKLRHWGLIEQRGNDDPAKRTSGVFRITARGIRFAHREIEVPSHAFIRRPGDTLIGMESTTVDVITALGKKFDYRDLMNGGPP